MIRFLSPKLAGFPACTLDTAIRPVHDESGKVSALHRVRSLLNVTADMPPILTRFFCVCDSLASLLLWAVKGVGALRPLVRYASLLTRPLPLALVFRSASRALTVTKKVHA